MLEVTNRHRYTTNQQNKQLTGSKSHNCVAQRLFLIQSLADFWDSP